MGAFAMLGLIYLILCVGVGYVIVRSCFPHLSAFCKTTYGGTSISLSPLLLCIPAWFLFGTVPMTWITYGLGYAFRSNRHPLFYANLLLYVLQYLLIQHDRILHLWFY